MRVLVIGGTGFIGPFVISRLSRIGHQVTIFHRGQHEPELPAEIRHIHSDSAAMPVTNFPDLVPPPDVVLHMHPMGEADARALMQCFRGVGRRVVAISSGDVYRAYGRLTGAEPGPPDPTPLGEEAPLREELYPYRHMAKSPEDLAYWYEKILVERLVTSDPALPGTVLRLPAVYGPGDHRRRFLTYLKRMDDGRPAILLEEAQARWRWSHGYVENVASAITLAVTDERAAGRIYNVGEPQVPAMAERIAQLAGAAGWSGKLVVLPKNQLPRYLQDPFNFAQPLELDTSRIRRELGYVEEVPTEEALARTIAWERAHPAAVGESPALDYGAEDAALARVTTQ